MSIDIDIDIGYTRDIDIDIGYTIDIDKKRVQTKNRWQPKTLSALQYLAEY